LFVVLASNWNLKWYLAHPMLISHWLNRETPKYINEKTWSKIGSKAKNKHRTMFFFIKKKKTHWQGILKSYEYCLCEYFSIE
jgi:hypothetical protein